MGLFNRHENDTPSDEGDLQLPTRDDFRQPLVEDSRGKATGRYSIDDAIGLIRQLPSAPDAATMAVICKTLESAQIKTIDILKDANQKEKKIRRQHDGIEQEIASLQAQIDERQKQLEALSESLDELTEIKSRFETIADEAPPEPERLHQPDETLDEQEPDGPLFSGLDEEHDIDAPATPISAGRRGRGAPRP